MFTIFKLDFWVFTKFLPISVEKSSKILFCIAEILFLFASDLITYIYEPFIEISVYGLA